MVKRIPRVIIDHGIVKVVYGTDQVSADVTKPRGDVEGGVKLALKKSAREVTWGCKPDARWGMRSLSGGF